MKKLLLGLGTVAAIVTPVVSVVACGSKTQPVYKEKNVFMSEESLLNMIKENNLIKLDSSMDFDDISNKIRSGFEASFDKWVRYQNYDESAKNDLISDFKKEYGTYDLNKEIASLKVGINGEPFNSKTQDIYIKSDMFRKDSFYLPASSSPDKPDYFVFEKNTNRILYTGKSKSIFSSLYMSVFDQTIADVPIAHIANFVGLRNAIKALGQFSDGPDDWGKQANSFEIMKSIFNISEIASGYWSSSAYSPEQIEKISKLKDTKEDFRDLIVDIDGEVGKMSWDFKKLKFDDSIYEADSPIKSRVEMYNSKLKDEFGDIKGFYKKFNAMFFKKYISDDALRSIVSKYHFVKISKDPAIADIQNRELNKMNLLRSDTDNLKPDAAFLTADGNNINWYTDTYYSISEYKGVKKLIQMYVYNDGTNKLQITGEPMIEVATKANGFKNAFDKGIGSAPIACIQDLLRLKSAHDRYGLFEDVIYSILGVNNNIRESELNEMEKARYKEIEDHRDHNNQTIVETIENGKKEFTLLSIDGEYSNRPLKLDMSIYENFPNDIKIEQEVRANRLNNILKSNFESKDDFYEKLNGLFL